MDSEEMQMKMWQDERDRLARKKLASLREVQRKIEGHLALERDIEEWLAVCKCAFILPTFLLSLLL